ncbi:MAG: LON peptidase substrate-binding domain-containing protein, partial [Ignavibacteriota bacterium]
MSKEKTTKTKKISSPKGEQIDIESNLDLQAFTTSEETTEITKLPPKIPVLALRDVIIFPYMIFPVLVGRETSLSATMSAMAREKYLFLVAQKNSAVDDPGKDELFHHGTLAKIVRIIRLPNGLVKVLVDGLEQAVAKKYLAADGHIEAELDVITPTKIDTPELVALVRHTSEQFRNYVKHSVQHPPEVMIQFENMSDPRRKLFYIAAHI